MATSIYLDKTGNKVCAVYYDNDNLHYKFAKFWSRLAERKETITTASNDKIKLVKLEILLTKHCVDNVDLQSVQILYISVLLKLNCYYIRLKNFCT